MKILCCGCSFTYGDELKDRNQAWPYRLATMLDSEVYNFGQQAASNRQILHQVIRGVEEHAPDYVFVQWSLLYRTEHSDNDREYVVWPGRKFLGNPKPLWREHVKWVSTYNQPEWYAEQYHFVTTLLDHYLTARSISFIQVDFNPLDEWALPFTNWAKSNYYLQPNRYLTLQNAKQNICDWYHPYPKGSGQHPLEEGHQAIAQHYYEHYRNLSGIS